MNNYYIRDGLKIMNLFSFNQYLFSDRTKLNLKKDYQSLIILFYFSTVFTVIRNCTFGNCRRNLEFTSAIC